MRWRFVVLLGAAAALWACARPACDDDVGSFYVDIEPSLAPATVTVSATDADGHAHRKVEELKQGDCGVYAESVHFGPTKTPE